MKIPRPRRRMRNGKPIGNYIVKHKGQWTNLETKDARLANERAELLVRGLWPQTAQAAADATIAAATDAFSQTQGEAAGAASLSPAIDPDDGEDDEDSEEVEASTSRQESAPSSSPPPSSPEGDPVAAAAAAAGGAAPGGLPSGDEVAAELGISSKDLEELVPNAAAEGLLVAQAWLVEYGARYLKKRAVRVGARVPDDHVSRRLIVAGVQAQLRRWESKLANLEPWHVIAAGLVAGAAYQLQHLDAVDETTGRVIPLRTPEAG